MIETLPLSHVELIFHLDEYLHKDAADTIPQREASHFAPLCVAFPEPISRINPRAGFRFAGQVNWYLPEFLLPRGRRCMPNERAAWL